MLCIILNYHIITLMQGIIMNSTFRSVLINIFLGIFLVLLPTIFIKVFYYELFNNDYFYAGLLGYSVIVGLILSSINS